MFRVAPGWTTKFQALPPVTLEMTVPFMMLRAPPAFTRIPNWPSEPQLNLMEQLERTRAAPPSTERLPRSSMAALATVSGPDTTQSPADGAQSTSMAVSVVLVQL